MSTDERRLSANEGIKTASRQLRGTIAEGLGEIATGAIADADQQLVKFHGMYLQDDRDLRSERARKLLDKAYAFMLRLRIPGGVVSPRQWQQLDAIARDYAGGQMRLTTRQTVQFHGVIKSNLRATMQAIDAAALDTLAACGDVNRNVLASSNPHVSAAHGAAYALAGAISAALLPVTGAYREIWLDGEALLGEPEPEPIYGRTYLPRKFKTVVAVPPDNDVDIWAQDLGFIAIIDPVRGAVAGWNVTAGGGMGMTHGEPDTYPRAADLLGFIPLDAALAVAEAVVTTQRDWGDRTSRKHARLKYTIDRHGLDAFRAEVERRAGVTFASARAFEFTTNGDRLGWTEGADGRLHATMFVENGRLRDVPRGPQWLAGLRAASEIMAAWPGAEFRATANQNLILANLPPDARPAVDALFEAHALRSAPGPIRANSMACVALPTCGLALAESERYLPDLLTRIETIADRSGVGGQPIVLRMTGCPNGCARPYLAEIGLVGRGPGRYHLYLGGGSTGERLSKLYALDLDEAGILATLEPLFHDYAGSRNGHETFGDWVIRRGHVARTWEGRHFHEDTGAKRIAGAAALP